MEKKFEAFNKEKTIYQSHCIMPYSLAWYLENFPGSLLDEMDRFAARENGFLNKIHEANRELNIRHTIINLLTYRYERIF